MMPNQSRRAPLLLPGEAATVLSVIGWMFGVTGGLVIAASLTVLLGRAIGWSAVADVPVSPGGTLAAFVFAASYATVGLLLHQRRRVGAYLALGLVALRLFAMLLEPPNSLGGFIVPTLTVIAIVLAWPYLSANATRITSLRDSPSNTGG